MSVFTFVTWGCCVDWRHSLHVTCLHSVWSSPRDLLSPVIISADDLRNLKQASEWDIFGAPTKHLKASLLMQSVRPPWLNAVLYISNALSKLNAFYVPGMIFFIVTVLDFRVGCQSQIALKNIMLCDFLLAIPGVRRSRTHYPHSKEDKIECGTQCFLAGNIWLLQFG